MYLIDQMRLVVEARRAGSPIIEGIETSRWIASVMDDILGRAELVLLEPSALALAADLRIDTPDRLDRMIEVLFREPRNLFIETVNAERMAKLAGMRGFPRVQLQPDRHDPSRVGLHIHVEGNGRGTIRPVWCFPRRLGSGRISNPGLSRLEREALEVLSRFGIGHSRIVVDTARRSSVGFAEFALRSDLQVPGLMAASAAVAKVTRKAVLHEAWRTWRLNSTCTAEFDRDSVPAARECAMQAGLTPEEFIARSEHDLDGELIHALAVMAVVAARETVPTVLTSIRKGRDAKRVCRPGRNDILLDRIGIVSAAPVHALREPAPGTAFEAPASGRASPVRHPVRGHLFLARNGRLTWRNAHWRGDAEKLGATRIR
ncbi:hypothetical protein LAZ40_09755 [Cereibacter sphaeroides]|uniref:hypothetical protein n=1 Tax=Cereibacter sphaeroides TaxID=1063 RepID=UPI001F3F2D76|nr:hypothetical protein [Cereibacter sphaeroides]MCE6959335.1 hypothetical protein [Cereibacter sphaeroides]MCE6972927.1 hypothetical protein [Cereibacter sphaeroides]